MRGRRIFLRQSMGKLQRSLMRMRPTSWIYQLSWAEAREKLMCFTKSFCTMFDSLRECKSNVGQTERYEG